MPRVKHQKYMYKEDVLEYSDEDIRFGTPEVVAEYRAEKLKCDCIIEVGCAAGFQTFPFAEKCVHVISVEIDRSKIDRARKNAQLLGFSNIIFVHGDALERKTIAQIKEIINTNGFSVGAVFLDTEREASEKERSLKTIKPSIPKFLEMYSVFSDNIAIEVPPHLAHDKMKSLPKHEKEYMSLNGYLNRLTLYFGGLRKCDTSLILLPAKKRFEKKEKAVIKEVSSVEGNKYIYEINPAVIAAELSTELFPHAYLFASGKKKYLLSDVHIMSELLDAYAILGIADKDNVVDSLLRLKAGKVTLRGNLKQDEYFRLKNSIESKLSGKKKFELFFFDKIIISEKL